MYFGNNHFIGNLIIRVVCIQSTVLHAGIAEQYNELDCCRPVDFLCATTAAATAVMQMSANLTCLLLQWYADHRQTNSSAVAKRPRNPSCLSVVSFNSTKRRVESFIVCYVGYRFITACRPTERGGSRGKCPGVLRGPGGPTQKKLSLCEKRWKRGRNGEVKNCSSDTICL